MATTKSRSPNTATVETDPATNPVAERPAEDRPPRFKALLVAVGKYGNPAIDLAAPVEELGRWKSLLESPRYGFEVEPLADKDATRDRILEKVRWLIEGARPDDRLLFGFFGHGCLARSLFAEPSEANVAQQGIIAFPGDGSLRAAVITDSELAAEVLAAAPPLDTDLTLVLDSCFSGNIRIPPSEIFSKPREERPSQAIPLFVPGVDPELEEALRRDRHPFIRLFGSFGAPPLGRRVKARSASVGARGRGIEQPIVVAACEPDNFAFQITVGGVDRLVFSMRALEELGREREDPQARPSYRQLVDAINQKPGFVQPAFLAGDTSDENDPFPGAFLAADDPNTPPLPRQPGPTGRAAADEGGAPRTLYVHIEGIACHLAPLTGSTFRKRVVMPHDPSTAADRHITFVEIAQADIFSANVAPTAEYSHIYNEVLTGDVRYSRWHLTGHRITITNTAAAPELSTTSAFDRCVPQMKKIQPRLRTEPDEDCFSDRPTASRIAGLMDMKVGTLDVGPLAHVFTQFNPPKDWPRGREPMYTVLRLPLNTGEVKVILAPFNGTTPIEIILRSTATWIRIGNSELRDITGPGSFENPAEHFKLYYNLSDPVTLASLGGELPVPGKALVPINACTNTTWP